MKLLDYSTSCFYCCYCTKEIVMAALMFYWYYWLIVLNPFRISARFQNIHWIAGATRKDSRM
jgi:hypothetical protein